MARERSEAKEGERPERRDAEAEAPEPEGQVSRPSGDRGESAGDPDVLLDVPVLNVEELDLEVEDLRARVSFGAELADMVKINVGIDAEVGKAKINLQGVEVQAQLKARLDNVRAIFGQVLTALERNPELAQNMLRSAEDPGDADRTGGVRTGPGGRGPGAVPEGDAEVPSGGSGGEEPGGVADLGDEGVPGEATEAARRRAEELGLDLSGVRGTGSGGRILVRDVEDAGG